MALLSEHAYEVGGPGFENVEAAKKHQEKVYEALIAESDALPEGEVVGGILRYPVGAGEAIYRVVKADPLTLQHVPIFPYYELPAESVAKLTLWDVRERLKTVKRITHH